MKRLALVAALAACGNQARAPRDAPPDPIAGLRAWARLYGVLRYWHPSDEAAALDWQRLAVLGVSRLRDAHDAAAIEAALEPLIAPFAPTVRIGDGAPPDLGGGDAEVAWQYQGAGFDDASAGVYAGKRTNRDLAVVVGDGWTSFAQVLDATPYRGKPLRYRANVRAEDAGGRAVGASRPTGRRRVLPEHRGSTGDDGRVDRGHDRRRGRRRRERAARRRHPPRRRPCLVR